MLRYDKYYKYDKYNNYKYIDDKPSISGSNKLKRIEQELNSRLFDCPICTKHGIRVTIKVTLDRDLFTGNYFIQVICLRCGAHNSMQISSSAWEHVKEIDFVITAAIKDTIFSLRDTIDKQDTIDKDLDAMIDEDWKLAGS